MMTISEQGSSGSSNTKLATARSSDGGKVCDKITCSFAARPESFDEDFYVIIELPNVVLDLDNVFVEI